MRRTSVGTKLYISVLAIFLIFATAFIVFQHIREKKYKVEILNTRLQNYNLCMAEAIKYEGGMSEEMLSEYIKNHNIHSLRVTILDTDGNVIFDNQHKNYGDIKNHSDRKEIKMAMSDGAGYAISRHSATMNLQYFYSATYLPDDNIIIRTSLPYDKELTKLLDTDLQYIWFTLTTILILTLVLYRFVRRLSVNITKLRIFARRAAHNESLDTEDLVDFPADELGEIAERIIKIYKRLQSTKQEQNKLKRQLTQNIAHELKTPVASIHGYLETIIENPQINKDTKEQFLNRCYDQSKRLTSLLQDISTLNRLDDAPEMIGFEDVNVTQIICDIAHALQPQLAERNMIIHKFLPDDIVIRGNSSLIYSIFRNLADNAICYAGDDTTISITAEDKDNKWLFTFSDNGTGVPQEHLIRLFERFYRIDKGRSRKMGGTGLGLAIVKNAVLLHGGSITVKNNDYGHGLCFTFSLMK